MHEKIYRLLKIKDELQTVEKIFLEHIQNKDELNPPQEKIANKLYTKYFEGDWLDSYGPKKRRIARSCAKYWVNNPPKHLKREHANGTMRSKLGVSITQSGNLQ